MIVRKKKVRREKDEKNKTYLIHESVQRKDKRNIRGRNVFFSLLAWFNTKCDERNIIEEKRNISLLLLTTFFIIMYKNITWIPYFSINNHDFIGISN